jgi:hypothetical protein
MGKREKKVRGSAKGVCRTRLSRQSTGTAFPDVFVQAVTCQTSGNPESAVVSACDAWEEERVALEWSVPSLSPSQLPLAICGNTGFKLAANMGCEMRVP